MWGIFGLSKLIRYCLLGSADALDRDSDSPIGLMLLLLGVSVIGDYFCQTLQATTETGMVKEKIEAHRTV